MRALRLMLWDARFHIKYGFYLLYAIFTAIYMALLFALPDEWMDKTAVILIFTDPAAMGMFFMGAIILLEKSQHMPGAYAVSPVTPSEFVAAQVASLTAISLLVAAVLAVAAGVENLPVTLVGVLVSSCVFTLISVIVAVRVESLNQFILFTVPVELAVFIPSMFHLFGASPDWLGYYPFNICIDMVDGKAPTVVGALVLLAVIAALFGAAARSVDKMWRRAGGGKL